MRTIMKIQSLIGVSLCLLLVGCGPSAVRKYAGILAVDTGKLNEQFELLTKAREEIDSTREDLNNSLELAILQTEDYTARRLDVWRSLKENNPTYGRRISIFTSLQAASEVAFTREETMRALSSKLDIIRKEPKGKKSDELGAVAMSLTVLSKEASLTDSIKFLVGFGRNVRSDLKKAEESADNASQSATKKSAAIKDSEIKNDLSKINDIGIK